MTPKTLVEKYGAVNHTDPQKRTSFVNAKQPLPSNYLAAHPFFNGHPQLRDEVRRAFETGRKVPSATNLGREFACAARISTIRLAACWLYLGEKCMADTYIFHTADHGIAIGRHD
jgi:hypothetical protein